MLFFIASHDTSIECLSVGNFLFSRVLSIRQVSICGLVFFFLIYFNSRVENKIHKKNQVKRKKVRESSFQSEEQKIK